MIAPDDQIYLRPTAFVDAPLAHARICARLAGGALSFSALDVIIRAPGHARHATHFVPLHQWEDFCAALPAAQQASARTQYDALTSARPAMTWGAQILRFDQPVIMGIVNVTPDSFSDGGAYMAEEAAIAAAQTMIAQGAAILDIGGESTRPGAQTVWEEDEVARVLPLLRALQNSPVLRSIDTRKASVMQAALAQGVHILNDVAALGFDERAPAVARDSAAAVVLMHAQGTPQTMQHKPHYVDAALDVFDWLHARRDWAVAQGIALDRIWLDPGIGFGKGLRHNLEIMNHLGLYHALGCPLLLGASRKRMIGAIDQEAPADARLGGSLACVMMGLAQGVQILRVHDVREAVQALRVWQAARDTALLPPAQ